MHAWVKSIIDIHVGLSVRVDQERLEDLLDPVVHLILCYLVDQPDGRKSGTLKPDTQSPVHELAQLYY